MNEHIFNIHDVVLLITLAESVLLAIFQTLLPAKNRLSSILLASFLFSIAVNAACILVLWNPDVHITDWFDEVSLPFLLSTALLMKGPTLYLYVLSITRNAFKIRRQDFFYLLTFVPIFLVLIGFHLLSKDLRYWVPEHYLIVNILWLYFKIVPLLFVIAAVAATLSYRRSLENQFSDFSPTEPGWLSILTLGFLFSWTLSLSSHVIAQFSDSKVSDYFGITDNYVTFILINALFIYSLIYAHKLLATKHEISKEKMDEQFSEGSIEKVRLGMEVDQHYLKHNLNIEEFSKRINLPIREVSAVINKHYDTNFFEFINSYRVEHAKKLLLDAKHAETTVLDILLQSGFNSKSAFHRFFSRIVGVSPSEFRKNAQ